MLFLCCPTLLQVGYPKSCEALWCVLVSHHWEDKEPRLVPKYSLRRFSCASNLEDDWDGRVLHSGLEEDEVQMRVTEATSNMWKHGFILEGIEVRPKHVWSVKWLYLGLTWMDGGVCYSGGRPGIIQTCYLYKFFFWFSFFEIKNQLIVYYFLIECVFWLVFVSIFLEFFL